MRLAIRHFRQDGGVIADADLAVQPDRRDDLYAQGVYLCQTQQRFLLDALAG